MILILSTSSITFSSRFILNVELDQTNNEYMTIRTADPDKFYCLIPELVVESGLVIDEMTSEDAGLEAVFEYLTKRR